MNSPSSNQLLQKLQNLHLTQKKTIQHSHSPKHSEINQFLHAPSTIPYLQIKQCDVGQLTDRIVREMDKHTSFAQIENPLEIQHFQHANPPIQISSLTHIDKKLKQLKYAKDHDHNIFAAVLTKMKLFCLDNSTICFDFYRCTDLILLKYMIYLLILELNQETPNNQQEPVPEYKQQFQSMVKDIVIIIYEIIEKIKSKQHINPQMDILNNQLIKIQNSFKPQPNSPVKTIKKPSHHREFGSCNLENNKAAYHQNILATEISTNSNHHLNNGQQKIIKYQIDELEQKSKIITSLNDQILKLQNNNKQQILSISELNAQIESIISQLQSKTDESNQKSNMNFQSQVTSFVQKKKIIILIFTMILNWKIRHSNKILRNTKQLSYINQVVHDQIKSQFDQYQNETYSSYQQQCNQLQQIKDNEIKQLKIELNEKSSIINQLLEDALFFGKQYKQIVERIVTISQDDNGKEVQQMQKEILFLENTVNAKLNAISSYSENMIYDSGQEFLQQSQLSNKLVSKASSPKSGNQQLSRTSEFLNGQKNQFELMQMLLAQCQVLEEFLL
ncbi:unnamed protein product (macronuclear) [Paramecium tetraurelia]|uniref:Uncharacterized protein n=1 Tax=Paramecium tetraurelia TaxID=5888 RepID=A0BWA4_PARTE|nr:uncharacterized protein GSPATT00032673001 [Paramecium tetraurelia]CAK62821.1 unnamed protein product [Paramecium tetraurelia]|eukprot:XP_001430219.1 hypothetical protein (macronuclear) [Paramecium tetraurelia strain d4-2]